VGHGRRECGEGREATSEQGAHSKRGVHFFLDARCAPLLQAHALGLVIRRFKSPPFLLAVDFDVGLFLRALSLVSPVRGVGSLLSS